MPIRSEPLKKKSDAAASAEIIPTVRSVRSVPVTEETAAEFQAKFPERTQALNEFAMGLMAEGIVTLSGRRLYTSSAVTDEVVEETLEKFDRLFASYVPA